MSSCLAAGPRRALADVDDLDPGGQVLQQRPRAEPVRHDDVGLPQRLHPAHGDQVRIPRATADQDDPATALAFRTGRDGERAVVQLIEYGIADSRRIAADLRR